MTEEKQYELGTAPYTCGLQLAIAACVLLVFAVLVWRLFFR